MMRVLLLVALGLAVVSALPAGPQRIVGGTVTTIDNYPFAAIMLMSPSGTGTFSHNCGGTIINNRSILTAAHCFTIFGLISQWRIRVGSSFASSGGVVHMTNRIINHPNWNTITIDSDIAIVHSTTEFGFNNYVRNGDIAGPNYFPADDQPVMAIGWGRIASNLGASEQLRHVQLYVINQDICRTRYGINNQVINDNMICAGVLDVDDISQCQGDSGGPLIHNNVIIGVCSFASSRCDDGFFPNVNARVSRYASWIQINA